MRAFKKLIAGVLACAMLATMATSAFAAATLGDNGKVTLAAGDYTAAEGKTTVLIVPADVWQSNAITGLTNDHILYIDQYESDADATAALAAGLGVKGGAELEVGDYYVLLGGNTNNGEYAISALSLTVVAEEDNTRTIQLGDCDGATGVTPADSLAILKHFAGMESLTGDYLIAADCDGATGVTPADSLAVLKHFAGMETLGTVTVTD